MATPDPAPGPTSESGFITSSVSALDSTVLNVPLCYSIISSLVGVSVGQYCIECSIMLQYNQ